MRSTSVKGYLTKTFPVFQYKYYHTSDCNDSNTTISTPTKYTLLYVDIDLLHIGQKFPFLYSVPFKMPTLPMF